MSYTTPIAGPIDHHQHEEIIMGKGDVRTRRGKIYRGTHGKTRPAGEKKRDHAAEAKSTK